MVGGADKWPLHFYWTHLAMRIGGKAAFEAALRGENGGFEGETFVKAGELFKQLVDLQPFQTGFLGFKNPQAVGYLRRRQGRDDARASAPSITQQRALAADKMGLSDDKLGWFDFPTVPGGKGEPTDTLGGINGWLVTKGAPKEAAEFLKFFVSQGRAEAARRRQLHHSGRQGRARPASAAPSCSNIAQNLANSKYHQNFYDQILGPSVGRVVNDVSAEIAGGSMTPEAAAKAIQDAWKQGN